MRAPVTHILAWRCDATLRWFVAAGTDRGERQGARRTAYTRDGAVAIAGRMARETGADELLIVDGLNVTRQQYQQPSGIIEALQPGGDDE